MFLKVAVVLLFCFAASAKACSCNCDCAGSYTVTKGGRDHHRDDDGHQCRRGYALGRDGVSCYDVDECERGEHKCDQKCVNARGTYICQCYPGYKLKEDGVTCMDMDECMYGTYNCNQHCINTVGGYMCDCEEGYHLTADNATCVDINECEYVLHNCQSNDLCYNNVGSFECDCNDGYTLGDDGATCYDIDECEDGSHNCSQNCNNTVGGFECSCNDGYNISSDGVTCVFTAPLETCDTFSFVCGTDVVVSMGVREDDATIADIEISAYVADTQYLAIGFSQTHNMLNSDILVCALAGDGTVVTSDRWAATRSQPVIDDNNDILSSHVTRVDGLLTCRFSRYIDTTDAMQDINLEVACLSILAAKGDFDFANNVMSYHTENCRELSSKDTCQCFGFEKK